MLLFDEFYSSFSSCDENRREREGEEGERFVSKGFEGLEKEGKMEGEGGRFDDGLATRQHGRRKNIKFFSIVAADD